ncbi:hypothetical protein FRB90_009528 [Tulasnella sp. 427]|nr:hypothetical protein FRB90_009528 [Tulasnella sp. 427]
MSRLASLKGPSSPSPNPAKGQKVRQSPAKSPSSKRDAPGPSIYDRLEPDTTSPSEATYHRKLRTLLLELKGVTKTWNDLILVDGLKAAKGLVDARTELDNSLAALPSDVQPRLRLVTPKLAIMDARIKELDGVVLRLQRQFKKMTTLVDSVDALIVDAYKTKGWSWVSEEPLWLTWTFERFASRLPTLLPPYHRSLYLCIDIVEQLRPHSTTFEDSRTCLRQWIAQPWLAEAPWEEWEQICEVEVDKWKDLKSV